MRHLHQIFHNGDLFEAVSDELELVRVVRYSGESYEREVTDFSNLPLEVKRELVKKMVGSVKLEEPKK